MMTMMLVLSCCRSQPCCEFLSSSSCLFDSLFYGQIIIAEIQFCDPSYFKRLHFCTIVSTSHPLSRKTTHPPGFYCPRNWRSRKMWFLYPKSRYLPIFVRFSPVIKSNMNRFRNGFHCRILFGKLYNNVAQSLSRRKLRSIKIIIEIFLTGIRFWCVSSVVCEAITISISRDILARRTEQFDTTHDSLGRKLTNMENCNFRSASHRFRKRRLFWNRYNKSIFCPIS